MAADQHIHIADGVTETELREFNGPVYSWNSSTSAVLYHKFSNTPNIWVGEVSWLKAALFDDSDSFVPDSVATIAELIPSSRFTLIDTQLVEKVKAALQIENKTSYSTTGDDSVVEFLNNYLGKYAFTISW